HRENARPQVGGAQAGDRSEAMKRTEVTYGQLDKVLRSLGFSCRVVTHDPPPARVYEHKESGASIIIPPFPMDDFVYAHHLLVAPTTVGMFGVAEPEAFDAMFQKRAGRNHTRSPAGGTQAGDGLASTTRPNVTYGQLDKALRSLGFTSRVVKAEPPVRV